MNPHQVTKDFEHALALYTDAPYVVTTTSCTQAILMACAWWHYVRGPANVTMPKLSYVGVPAAIKNAGHRPSFVDEDWQGQYAICGVPRDGRYFAWAVVDAARRFTSGMYRKGQMQCVSFHWAKTLGLSQGGAILLDDPDAAAWLRRARFDGRTEGVDPKDDQVTYPSWHAYLSPEVAAHGLMKLSLLPKHNADLPRSDYGDLSLQEAFKQ